MKQMSDYIVKKVITGLATLGCIDSLYLLLTKYQCTTCKSIHNSIWGRPFGIPIALFGLITYLFLLIIICSGKKQVAYILATAGLLISLFLVYVQFNILKSFCIFCIISAILLLSIWLVLTTVHKNQKEIKLYLVFGSIILVFFIIFHLPVGDTYQNSAAKMISQQNNFNLRSNNLQESNINKYRNDNSKENKKYSVKAQVYKRDENLRAVVENKKSIPIKSNDDIHISIIQQTPKTETVSPKPFLFYYADGSSVNIDISKENILFFSPSCEACLELLSQVTRMPKEKRPILIDTFIENEKEHEIKEVDLKLSQLSLNSVSVLYDFDHNNPVTSIPTLIGYKR